MSIFAIRIDLNSIQFYEQKENQLCIWREMRGIYEAGHLSHDGILDEMSKLFALKGLKVYTPLRGDVGGLAVFNVPDVTLFGSRRWLSYYLMPNQFGCPKHFPVRYTARVQLLDLYIRIKKALREQP